ncbi:MAG TPA: pyrroloquinoline quinone biosynthesis protein PqqE [Polyangiaceae bacterium]
MTPRPFTLVAELTYRCPLGCPYCSNPVEYGRFTRELDTASWQRVFQEAAALGVVQVHLTGGEPLLRDDLELLIRFAQEAELYTNVVTSGVPLDRKRWQRIVHAGVDHVQISLQAPTQAASDRIAGRHAFDDKRAALGWALESGVPLTLNVVLHRESLAGVEGMIDFALEFGIPRLELAHTQYHGFALKNRDTLLPDAAAVEQVRRVVKAARARLAGKLEITHVLPDYHAGRPKACMDGWGQRYIHVAPDGLVAPCHSARSMTSLTFENVSARSLSYIWHEAPSFRAFRGYEWMKEPCRSCERRELDFGGCRCQAFALTGDASATDPACVLAPAHELVLAAREAAAARVSDPEPRRYLYRSPRADV